MAVWLAGGPVGHDEVSRIHRAAAAPMSFLTPLALRSE